MISKEEKKEENEREKRERLIRIISIVVSIAIAAGAGYVMYIGFMNNDFMMILIGFILFSVTTSLINVGIRATPPLMKAINTVTVIKCQKCDYTEIRDFKKGDYIFEPMGQCPKCDGQLYIKTIYTVEPKKKANP